MDMSFCGRADTSMLILADNYATNDLNINDFEGVRRSMLPQSPQSDLQLPSRDDAERDVDVMLASLGLQLIRRYMGQHHWYAESQLARAADEAEPGLKLENVAAHSWHVADATLLLASNFPKLNGQHALELAILHDKLELFTGDLDPVGPDGQGTASHAFNPAARVVKTELELVALERYIAQLRVPIRERQRALMLETIYGESAEAQLVKGVDKIQALTFVLAKKAGTMTDEHLNFSLRYSAKAIDYFPGLIIHYRVLVQRLLTMIAEYRQVSIADVAARLSVAVRPLAHAALV